MGRHRQRHRAHPRHALQHQEQSAPSHLSSRNKPKFQKRIMQSLLTAFGVLCLSNCFILAACTRFLPKTVQPLMVLIAVLSFPLSLVVLSFAAASRKRLHRSAGQVVRKTKKAATYSETGSVSLERFKRLVQEALQDIPAEFHKRMDNVVILVESEPDEETLERVGVKEGSSLLGLYQGVPLTQWQQQAALLPERITLYQRSIETYCHGDPERIREQVRTTLFHEIAHHFGIAHDEVPIWVR